MGTEVQKHHTELENGGRDQLIVTLDHGINKQPVIVCPFITVTYFELYRN